MLERIVALSIRHPWEVIFVSVAAALIGIAAAFHIPIDAVPDITPVQVQINTEVPTLAPEEIERLVTTPIETAMAGLPHLTELRSISKFGLSQVVLNFKDGTDIYRARQLVAERIAGLGETIPDGLTPTLAPIATGLGEIFYYIVAYRADAPHKPAEQYQQLQELSLVQEYMIKPLLRQTPGIAEVNTSGGYTRQILIAPDPEKLSHHSIGFEELIHVIRKNMQNSGGGHVEIGHEQIVIRARTQAAGIEEISKIPIRYAAGVRPILLGDLAEISISHAFRYGASTENGEEAVVGIAVMLAGENSRVVAQAVKKRLREIQKQLPEGIEIREGYDRSVLVNKTIRTVEQNLFHGAVLVVAVLLLLLGNWRGAIIVTLAIPLSFLLAITGMVSCGLSANLMSLGAIDFGLIVDGAVVMIENIVRRIGERRRALGRELSAGERFDIAIQAGAEVAKPMFFGVLIITVVYVPILSLTGIEGKMFQPMAVAVMFCLIGALILSLTLMPALGALFLKGKFAEEESLLVRLCKAIYRPILKMAFAHRGGVVGAAVILFIFSWLIFKQLGAEFVPQLDEGDLSLQMIRGASVGLEASLTMQKRTEELLLKHFPEIRHIFSRIGTAEIAMDPMGPNVADTYIMLNPRETWRKENGRTISKERLIELMREMLEVKAPGQAFLFTQPIQLRFNEIMAGARANLALKIYGDDFETLEELAAQAREILVDISGAGDVEVDPIGRQPMVEIIPKPEALSRYGVQGEEIGRVVAQALGGEEVGQFIEGNRRLDIVVRLKEGLRREISEYERLPLQTERGEILPLGEVAEVKVIDAVGTIFREWNQRRVVIMINPRGRDMESFVREAQMRLQREMNWPSGYFYEFGGQFKNLIEARQRLSVVVPVALAMILGLLFLSFRSWRQATLVMLCVPLAMTGGVWALWWRGMPFTISAGIGFIALSGIAVLNGVMLVSFINQLRQSGMSLREAVWVGTLTRLRPKLMTALTTAIGFVPMAIATGTGAEVQRPLATVVIGGVLSATFLTLVVLPVLYDWVESFSDGSRE
ncbi:MAG: CusA/CzcA family heavy metal efflux RND transporter [Methylacidiphilales bacterium]|nr:CusA/CzcA family heavy metal efflux RND transporter [Candidatus Methylacidiphilales bacterium]MDW8350065.1 CusA/CzcA family heavy metal efflux RND transporter [Verrucomicrobiae bacterium]